MRFQMYKFEAGKTIVHSVLRKIIEQHKFGRDKPRAIILDHESADAVLHYYSAEYPYYGYSGMRLYGLPVQLSDDPEHLEVV